MQPGTCQRRFAVRDDRRRPPSPAYSATNGTMPNKEILFIFFGFGKMTSTHRTNSLLPYYILAAILLTSILIFVRTPHVLQRSHGLALIGAIAVFAAWFRYRNEVSVWQVAPAFALILFVFFRGRAFHQLSLGGSTYDLYLLYVDRGFGFQPSLATYGFVERFGLFPFISAVYESLILCIGLCYATQIGAKQKAGRVFSVLLLPIIIGPLAYRLLPACGPVWLLGSPCYTGEILATCANIPFSDLAQVRLDGAWPRNAMPSMHLAWALLIWWTSREMKFGRWMSLAFVCGTALATLGGGEHYLVDLVAAFPFSLGVWSLCMGDVPLHHPRRMLPLAGSCAVVLGWIGLIRYAPRLFWISPILTWIASACIVAGTVIVLSICWPVSSQHDASVAEVLPTKPPSLDGGN
jgi:hypothetical protein